MSKHTPGPWNTSGAYRDSVYKDKIAEGGLLLADCRVSERPPEVCEANARLIAAAPELLFALRELVAEADEHPGWEGHPHADTAGFQFARAAIAKAEGRTNETGN